MHSHRPRLFAGYLAALKRLAERDKYIGDEGRSKCMHFEHSRNAFIHFLKGKKQAENQNLESRTSARGKVFEVCVDGRVWFTGADGESSQQGPRPSQQQRRPHLHSAALKPVGRGETPHSVPSVHHHLRQTDGSAVGWRWFNVATTFTVTVCGRAAHRKWKKLKPNLSVCLSVRPPGPPVRVCSRHYGHTLKPRVSGCLQCCQSNLDQWEKDINK